MSRRIKLELEYDGTDFLGWQIQNREREALSPAPAVRTVQGEVEGALRKLTGKAISISGASRTDVGVHAAGQVASFDLPDEVSIATAQLVPGLNAYLPPDASVIAAQEMPADFHARHAAAGKLYRYQIFNRLQRSARHRRTHWQVGYSLDLPAMTSAAQALLGTHDFSAFTVELSSTQSKRSEAGKAALSTVRELQEFRLISENSPAADSGGQGGEISIYIKGSGFLYKMIRTLVGSLVEVGRGQQPPEWLAQVLASKDRRRAGPTAPAHGLCLLQVFY